MKQPSLAARLKNLAAGLRFAAKAIGTRHTPLLAQMVVTRRCNLACGYCNEYDDFSAPVPTAELERRIDHLASLGTASLTLTGGEPLLHPDMDRLVRYARKRGMIVTTITNGFRLSGSWIERLNAAGLNGMQVSIDNLKPDDISMKSLASVENRLKLLSEKASFNVNVNSVMGVTGERTEDIVTIAETAARYGLQHSVGLLHDGSGLLKPLSAAQKAAYRQVTRISPSLVHWLNYRLFQRNLMEGKPNDWKCRAGARYLYITEDGAVHWCSQQRGWPGKPLLRYTKEDIRREYATEKGCAATCTLSCVHQMSMFDRYRGKQQGWPGSFDPRPAAPSSPAAAPAETRQAAASPG
jgi:MoaA/NifB/PqqE/SkfB family radical SAM enzyme